MGGAGNGRLTDLKRGWLWESLRLLLAGGADDGEWLACLLLVELTWQARFSVA